MASWRDVLVVCLAALFGALSVLAVRAWLQEPRLAAVDPVRREAVEVPTALEGPSPAERGRHLVDHVLACGACHGDGLGGALVEGPGGTRIWAPDLTATGAGARYDEAAWRRVLTEGIGLGGLPLRAMPVGRWSTLAPDDLDAVVRHLRTLPGPGRPTPRDVSGAGWGWWATEDPGLEVSPRRAPDVRHGAYLAALGGCLDCHGVDLRGGPARVGTAVAPALVGDVGTPWSGADFAAAVLRGEGRAGTRLGPSMPWRFFAGLHDTEVDALWAFVRALDAGEVAVAPPPRGAPRAP